MKYFFWLIVFALPFFVNAQSQVMDSSSEKVREKFDVPDVLAEFLGGNGELMKFVQKNLDYPEYERIHNIQGKVYIEFVIDEKGKPTRIKVKRSISPGLDAEAINIVRLMPYWTPGKKNDKPVRTRFVLPINFKIEKEEEPELYPTFVGKGKQNFYDYIKENLIYPEQAKNDTLQGVVRVKCFFDKEGKLKNYYLHESLSKECNEEAMRLIKDMPPWKKGKKQKKEQSIVLTIPFILAKKE